MASYDPKQHKIDHIALLVGFVCLVAGVVILALA